MIRSVVSLFVLCALGPSAGAQQFGFVHSMLPPDADATAAIVLADVDGDGDLDALVGNQGQSRLYRNDGNGVFADVTPTHLPLLSASTYAVALGDVDGDGDLDAFLGNEGQNRLYLNGGPGIFVDVTATHLPALLATTLGVALGDVDGDGDLDAILANGKPGYFGFPPSVPEQDVLLLNDGTGVFADATATQFPLLLDTSVDVELGDVDGDGDLDAFVGEIYRARLYLNDGAGTFSDATAPNLSAACLSDDLALADLDGDGDLDALGGCGVNLNDGSGIFTLLAPPPPGYLFGPFDSLAAGDVDGDGDPDVVVGARSQHIFGRANRLYLNDGSGGLVEVTSTHLPGAVDITRAVALGDVDGDGDLDACFGNGVSYADRQDRLFLNDGTAVFTEVTSVDVPVVEPRDATNAVALGDLDGDGFLDVYAANGAAYQHHSQDGLYLNDGSGSFVDVTATHVPANLDYTMDVVLGDFDGDGDLDVLTSNLLSPDALYLNDGTGVLTDVSATNLPPTLGGGGPLAAGDVDGDGDLDVFSGYLLALNDGSAVFTDATATNLPPAGCTFFADVALGDVDGDGDVDAILGTCLYLNDGSGTFVDATATHLPASFTDGWHVLGDVDGDGDLDVAFWNGLLLNDGTGVFVDATATNLPAGFSGGGLALGDVDGDGDLDAIRGTEIYLNGGSGVFSPAAASSPSLGEIRPGDALGDLDGDGDLDAFLGRGGTEGDQNRVLRNLSRQLSWRGLPRVGKPLTMDFHGPPLGAWFLAISFGPASMPIPPFGTLRIDPVGLIYLDEGLLDGQGRFGVTYAVPASPILIGAVVYWQGLVVSPARFTNLEITTLTNL